jgi:predicted dehydrogenase
VNPLRIVILGDRHVHLPDHQEALRRHGLPRISSPREADGVILGGAPADRERLLPLLAELRVPILAEKPLARTAEASAQLLAACPGRLTTAMFLRCTPAFQLLRHLMADDAWGEITAVHAVFSHPGWWENWFAGPAAWMADDAVLPGGGLTDLAIHLVDLLIWLDAARPLHVLAAHTTRRDPAGPVLAGAALLDWGGVPVTLHAGWTSTPGALRMSITGTRGGAEVDGGTLRLDRGTGGHEVYAGPAPSAGDAVDAFLASLSPSALPAAPASPYTAPELPDAAEILRCAELMDALVRS